MTATMQATKPQSQTLDTPQSTALDRILDQTQRSLAAKLRERTSAYSEAIEAAVDHVEKSLVIAKGVAELRRLLSDEVMDSYVMPLMNSELGFLTDKDPSKARRDKPVTPYAKDVVRECVITATLAGLRWVGNEFNIIGGRMMPVKNGWRRKVLETPGVTEADVVPGTPGVDGSVANVRVGAWVVRDGQTVELLNYDRKPGRVFSIPIKSIEWETPDTWKGKAERRAWKALFERLHGCRAIAGALEDDEAADATPATKPVNGASSAAAQTAAPKSRADALADKLGTPEQAPPAESPSESFAKFEKRLAEAKGILGMSVVMKEAETAFGKESPEFEALDRQAAQKAHLVEPERKKSRDM